MKRLNLKAFSIIEVTASIVILGIISGIVTLAIANAQFSSQKLRYENQVRSQLSSLANQIATQSYQSLADDSFTRPFSCSLGAKSSCLKIGGKDVEILWDSIEFENPDFVHLTGQTIVDGDVSLKIERDITPLLSNWANSSGNINLNIIGGNFTGSIYLMDSNNKVLASNQAINNSVAFNVTSLTCSNAHPCYLALSPSGSLTYNNFSLDPISAVGASSKIVYSGQDLSIDVKVNPISKLTVNLSALNQDGRSGSPKLTNTLCLYLKFNDSITDRYIQSCNNLYPDKIVFDTYFPNPLKENLELGIPANVNFTILSDKPGEKCLNKGLTFYKDIWSKSPVECSSYTWGEPSSILYNDIVYPFTLNNLTFPSSDATATLIYSSEAYPASGFSGDALWNHPRVARSCALKSSCLPDTENLEVTKCSLTYCLSSTNTPPYISGPLVGSRKVTSLFSTDSSGTFNLTFKNPSALANSRTDVYLKQSPDNAQLSINGNYLGDNSLIGSFTGQQGNLDLAFTNLESNSFSNIILQLKDKDSLKEFTLPLSSISVPLLSEPVSITTSQNSNSTLQYKIIGTNGEYLSGVTINSAVNGGFTFSPNGSSNSTGLLSIDTTVTNSSPGYQEVNLQLKKTLSSKTYTNTLPIPIFINPGLATLKLANTKLTIKGTSTLTASALDFSNNPLSDQLITFSVYDSQNALASGFAFKPKSCITDTQGICSVLLSTASNVGAGIYTLRASSSNLSDDSSITLAQRASIFNLSAVKILQNSSAKAVLILSDNQGAPLSNHAVTMTLPEGITVDTPANSDAKGKVILNFKAGSSATVGVNKISITSSGLTQEFTLLVLPKVSKIVTSDLNINGSETLTVNLIAYDINGNIAPNADITIDPYGLISPLFIRTDSKGRATFSIRNSLTPINTHTLTFHSNGEVITTLDVNVLPNNYSLITTPSLLRGLANQTFNIKISKDGLAEDNLKIRVKSSSIGVTLLANEGVSNNSGEISIPVTLSNKATGYIKFDITFNGKTVTKSVWIKM